MRCERVQKYVHRMYFSKSLSLSESIILGGGGWRNSFGLYIAFDLMLPISFICFRVEEDINNLSSQSKREDANFDLLLGPGVHSQALAK